MEKLKSSKVEKLKGAEPFNRSTFQPFNTSYFLPYQEAWINDDSPLKVAEKSRRVGVAVRVQGADRKSVV